MPLQFTAPLPGKSKRANVSYKARKSYLLPQVIKNSGVLFSVDCLDNALFYKTSIFPLIFDKYCGVTFWRGAVVEYKLRPYFLLKLRQM